MGLRRAARFCTALGLAIPLAFTVLYAIKVTLQVGAEHWLYGYWLYELQLLLWPSWLFMMVTDGEPPWSLSSLVILAISIAANSALYAFVGALIWLGVRKFKPLAYVTFGTIILAWYGLLSL